MNTVEVVRPQHPGKAIVRVIGYCQRLILRVKTHDSKNWAENFLSNSPHVVSHPSKHGWEVVATARKLSIPDPTPAEKLSTFLLSKLDV